MCMVRVTHATVQQSCFRPMMLQPLVSRHQTSVSGPFFVEEPTVAPSGKPFDLGPFNFTKLPEGGASVRLDRWVKKHVCSSWHAAQKLISSRQVWVIPPEHSTDQHRKSIMFPRFRPRCHGSTQVEPSQYIYFPRSMKPHSKALDRVPENSDVHSWILKRILYKDSDFIVIDKPAGWAVGDGKYVGDENLEKLFPLLQFGAQTLPRLVHRTTADMSGVLLLARHKAASSYAKDMIKQRAFWQRSLWGLVCGRTPKSGTISMPLCRERRGAKEVAKPCREDDGGASALTDYKTLRFSPLAGGLSLLELCPYTGRHHQTRAHCAFGLRAPLVGDPLYYELSNKLNQETSYGISYHSEEARNERKDLLGPQPRMHLHSRQMSLKTFANKDVVITAPLPKHMLESCTALGWLQYVYRFDHQVAQLNPWTAALDPHVGPALAELQKGTRTSQMDTTCTMTYAQDEGSEGVGTFKTEFVDMKSSVGRRSKRQNHH